MLRPAAQLLDSPTLDQQPSSEPSGVAVPRVDSARSVRTRLYDAAQLAVLVLYSIAAMMPQVRRALSALDRA